MMPAVTHPLWPLLDLRLTTGDLVLRLPTEDELPAFSAVAAAGIHPSDEMPFSVAVGYEPNGYGRLAPRGIPRETQRFRITLEDWRARPRPEVVVEGPADSLPLFGIEPP